MKLKSAMIWCALLSACGGQPEATQERQTDLETLDPQGQEIVFWYQHTREREEALQELIAETRKEGWTHAYREYLKSYFERRRESKGLRRKLRDTYLAVNGRRTPGIVRSPCCESQAYQWLLTSLNPQSIALDLGAGWNIVTHVWARQCKHLVAADAALERLHRLPLS